MLNGTLAVLLLSSISSIASIAAEHPDRVFNLPGAPAKPPFPLYAGFIKVHNNDAQHEMFYVLCEAIRADPLEAPLVVWLNGGPGASSLIGLLLENGPYILESGSDKLRYNNFSWNQYYNVLYLESPSGVGFSRSNKTILKYNDEETADLNKNVLHTFMNEVHPRYAKRDFFITGESYAGVYIPYLTLAILKASRNGVFTNDNFRGIAMGNPLIDFFSRRISAITQLYAMGTIPQKHGSKLFRTWEKIRGRMNGTDFNLATQYYTEFEDFWDILGATKYNLQMNCEDNEDHEHYHIAKPVKDTECTWREDTTRYMNRDDVQRALHVIAYGDEVIDWTAIQMTVYLSYYFYVDTVPLYRPIVDMAKDNFRILFYSGDVDLVCPSIHVARGARLIAENSDMEIIENSPQLWHYLNDFGGAQTSYRATYTNITMDVLTVRGAGHLVPINHPSRSFQIINNFISAPHTPINYSSKIRRRKVFIDKPAEQSEGSGWIIGL